MKSKFAVNYIATHLALILNWMKEDNCFLRIVTTGWWAFMECMHLYVDISFFFSHYNQFTCSIKLMAIFWYGIYFFVSVILNLLTVIAYKKNSLKIRKVSATCFQ